MRKVTRDDSGAVLRLHRPGAFRGSGVVSFSRGELSVILSTYSRMVAAGHWRDYRIACLNRSAVFSIFRRAAEFPIYRIVKRHGRGGAGTAYSVIGLDGRVLRRGENLRQVVLFFERNLIGLADQGR